MKNVMRILEIQEKFVGANLPMSSMFGEVNSALYVNILKSME